MFCSCISVSDATTEEEINKVGDTTVSEDENFEMTLTRAEIVDAVCLDKSREDLLLPIGQEEASKAPELALSKSLGHIVLSYYFDFRHVGKQESFDFANLLGAPTVTYDNEYEFSQKYFSVIANKSNYNWLVLSSDVYKNGLESMPGLKNMIWVPSNYVYEPLSKNVYEVRGVIILPEEVADEEKPLTIKFPGLGQEYTIR